MVWDSFVSVFEVYFSLSKDQRSSEDLVKSRHLTNTWYIFLDFPGCTCTTCRRGKQRNTCGDSVLYCYCTVPFNLVDLGCELYKLRVFVGMYNQFKREVPLLTRYFSAKARTLSSVSCKSELLLQDLANKNWSISCLSKPWNQEDNSFDFMSRGSFSRVKRPLIRRRQCFMLTLVAPNSATISD